jgi:hypothetical protein
MVRPADDMRLVERVAECDVDGHVGESENQDEQKGDEDVQSGLA